jgi:hypothetical protein
LLMGLSLLDAKPAPNTTYCFAICMVGRVN